MPFEIVLNVKSIKDKIERFSLPKAQNIGAIKAKLAADNKKKEFLEAFEEHPVSEEIKSGPGENYGINGENGNLFSFIGFDVGSDPIGDLFNYFDKSIKLSNSRGIYNPANKTLVYRVDLPSEEGIKKATDLSQYTTENNETGWGEGRSWAYSIERGIPGLNKYKFSDDPEVLGTDSRSGTGAIRKNIIHPGASYKARKYITELLKILTKV